MDSTTNRTSIGKVPGTKFIRQQTFRAPGTSYDQHGNIMVFRGSASQALGSEIASYLELGLGGYQRTVFSNENIFIQLKQSVRGQDVYLVQTMSSPLHDNIMEMLIMIDAFKRDSAGRINVVMPYLAYSRSDKKDQPRVPITARLLANMIEVAGADRYITVDLHAGQIQGFFNIPGDVLTAFYLISDYVKELNVPNLAVVAADLGFAKKARNWAEKLETPLVIVEKRRTDNAEHPEALSLIGDVNGMNCLLVDDEVLTAGSVENAVKVLREHGAKDVYLAFTHAVLADVAYERLRKMDLKEIIFTNTMELPTDKLLPNMTALSVAPLLGEVILRAHEGRSVGELFDE